MKYLQLFALFLIPYTLFPPALHGQANRWFGREEADSTRWGWNLPFDMRNSLWLPGDTTGVHAIEFSYVATDTAETKEEGYYVVFNGYWLTTTEITQAQWILVMGSPLPHWTQRGDLLPAVASKEEAEAFAQRFDSIFTLGLRLPTQEELDFAYHGGHYSEGYRYSGSDRLEWVAWTDGRLHPVAQKVPNELGFYDMDSHTGGFRILYYFAQHHYDSSR